MDQRADLIFVIFSPQMYFLGSIFLHMKVPKLWQNLPKFPNISQNFPKFLKISKNFPKFLHMKIPSPQIYFVLFVTNMSSVKEEQLVADLSTTPDQLQENLSRRNFKEAATVPTGGRPFVLNIGEKFLQTSVGWSKSYIY